MTNLPHRHDITDSTWALLAPLLPGQSGQWGGIAHDNRQFINAVFWILRTGAPWRDLPADYGGWKNTHRRFSRWRDHGVWEQVLGRLIADPDYAWLIIDASYCKARAHAAATAAAARAGNQATARARGRSTPRYILPWMRLVCRSESLSRKLPGMIARRL